MADEGLALTEDSLRRVERVVRRVEAQAAADAGQAGADLAAGQSPAHWRVKITSLTLTGGTRPGTWYSYDPVADAYAPQDAVRVKSPNAATLVVGKYYRGLLTGYNAAGVAVFEVVDVGVAGDAGGGGGSLTVQDTTGTPSYASTTTLQFDVSTGASLSQPAGNTVLVSLLSASRTQAGVVDHGALQTFGGSKAFHEADYHLSSTFWVPAGWSGLADTGPYGEAAYLGSLFSNGAHDGLRITFASNTATDILALEWDATGHQLTLHGSHSGAVAAAYAVVDSGGTVQAGVWATGFCGEVASGGLVTTVSAYTAAVAGNWAGGTPATTLADALDRIAAALSALGHKP